MPTLAHRPLHTQEAAKRAQPVPLGELTVRQCVEVAFKPWAKQLRKGERHSYAEALQAGAPAAGPRACAPLRCPARFRQPGSGSCVCASTERATRPRQAGRISSSCAPAPVAAPHQTQICPLTCVPPPGQLPVTTTLRASHLPQTPSTHRRRGAAAAAPNVRGQRLGLLLHARRRRRLLHWLEARQPAAQRARRQGQLTARRAPWRGRLARRRPARRRHWWWRRRRRRVAVGGQLGGGGEPQAGAGAGRGGRAAARGQGGRHGARRQRVLRLGRVAGRARRGGKGGGQGRRGGSSNSWRKRVRRRRSGRRGGRRRCGGRSATAEHVLRGARVGRQVRRPGGAGAAALPGPGA